MAWPNEPSGATLLTNFTCATKDGSGWASVFPAGGQLVTDATGELESPPTALKHYWFHNAGTGNSNVPYFVLSPSRNELYVGITWRPSNPFTGWGNNHNKLYNILHTDGSRIWIEMNTSVGQGGPYQIWGFLSYPGVSNNHLAGWGDAVGAWNVAPNTSQVVNVPLGQWHRLEVYVKTSTSGTSRDGILRWWLDGIPQGNHTTANIPLSMVEVQVTQSWDAFEPNFPNAYDEHLYGHFRISTGGSGGGGGEQPTVLPPPVFTHPVLTTEPYGPVTLEWTAVGGAAAYELTVHKMGQPYEAPWLFFGDVVGTSQIIQTDPLSEYDMWIRTKNSGGVYGSTNGNRFFTSASENPPDPDPDPDPPPPPVDPGPVEPPVVVTPPVLGTVTEIITLRDRLNPIKKRFKFYG